MDGDTSGGGGVFLSPLAIFLLVFVVEALDGFLEIVKKNGMKSAEEVQLREEIKELLKEASSLSTPSTFAQSAKLRRLAATKEKELLRKQEENKKHKIWIYVACGRVLMVFKVLLHGSLVLRFWGVPVAAVPQQLLQPFGRIFSWKSGSASSDKIRIGIVPWLVLSARVSKFLWQKTRKAFFSE